MSTCIDSPEITAIEKQIAELKQQLIALRRKQVDRSPVQDYPFRIWDGGEQKLSELFGDKTDLIIVHNMGKSCPYCTLWADGFNGLVPHLENRSAFFVVSNDSVDTQKQFADSRGWKFKMASSSGTNFFKDMGFQMDEGFWPGASMFSKNSDGAVIRTGHTYFGPGDDFCSVWHLFELLDGGTKDWQPKFRYDHSAPVQLGIRK